MLFHPHGPAVPASRFLCLGIESSANKVGVGIVSSSGEILSNPRCTFVTPAGTGFLPRETALHHQEKIVGLVEAALREAGVDPNQLQCIAYTSGPGMGAPLAVGAVTARALSLLWSLPLVAVNHCVAHIEMGRLVTECKNPVVLYVSGGNTQIIGYSEGRYRILGETLDVAVGNCIDRLARLLHLPNEPAPGYQVEQLAKRFSQEKQHARQCRPSGQRCLALGENECPKDHMLGLCPDINYGESDGKQEEMEELLPLPYAVKGMDLSFSGILTRLEDLVGVMHRFRRRRQNYRQDTQVCAGQSAAEFSKQGNCGVSSSNSVALEAGGIRVPPEQRRAEEADAVDWGAQSPGPEPTDIARTAGNDKRKRKTKAGPLAGSDARQQGEKGEGKGKKLGRGGEEFFEGVPVHLLNPESLCYSAQEVIFAMLTEVTERAMALYHANQVLVVGGVGCNLRLQQMLREMAQARGASMGGMDDRYCIDNGAMVAYVGCLLASKGQFVDVEDAHYRQRYRTDEVPILWREEECEV